MMVSHFFHSTRASREIVKVIEQASQSGSTVLVRGESGCGKSAMAGWLDCSASDVLVCTPDIPNSPLGILNDLLERVGRLPAATTRLAFVNLIQALADESIGAIVIDDGQRLARHSLEMLRALQDRSGVGLVLFGPRRLVEHLGEACPELTARMERCVPMRLLEAHDVFAMLLARHRTSGRRSLWELVETSRSLVRHSGGNFRQLQRLLREARGIARARHRALCSTFVQQAALGMGRTA